MNPLSLLFALLLVLPASSVLAQDAAPPGGDQPETKAEASQPAPSAAQPSAKEPRAPNARKRAFDPKAMADRQAEQIGKALKLSDEQAKKVQEILERDAARKLELQKKLQALERRAHEDIRAVLNDDQKESWDMMRARQDLMMQQRLNGRMGGMGAMRGRGPGMGPGGPGMGPGGPGMGGPGGPGEMGGPDGSQPPAPPPPQGSDGSGGDQGD